MVPGDGTEAATSVATGLRPVSSNLFGIEQTETAHVTWRAAPTPESFRDSAASLPRENQLYSRNHQHCGEAKRNYAHSKSPASQMRSDDAAVNCRGCQNESEGRNGADFCEIADQAGNGVHHNNQRRDCGGLSMIGPATTKQD